MSSAKLTNDNPDIGFISHEQWFGRTTIMVQYWKSFEHLEAYAKNKDSNHLPVWAKFNKDIGSNGDIGIWHETYLVKPGSFESIYNNMPTFGLAKAMNSVPAKGKYKSASDRLRNINGVYQRGQFRLINQVMITKGDFL